MMKRLGVIYLLAGLVTFTGPECFAVEGTVLAPKYFEGPTDASDDIGVHIRYSTYETDKGPVTSVNTSVMFTIDRLAKDVWPYFKDFNLWQNDYGHYYTGVLGDLEGKTFGLGSKPNEPGPHHYKIIKVIPEHLLVLFQPILEDGGISGGYHVFTLNEHGGKTVVTALMQHSFLMKDMTEDEALAVWQKPAPEWLRKWHDIFPHELTKLVKEGK